MRTEGSVSFGFFFAYAPVTNVSNEIMSRLKGWLNNATLKLFIYVDVGNGLNCDVVLELNHWNALD